MKEFSVHGVHGQEQAHKQGGQQVSGKVTAMVQYFGQGCCCQNPIKSELNVFKGFLQVIFKLDLVNLLMEMLVLLDINVMIFRSCFFMLCFVSKSIFINMQIGKLLS